MARRCGYCCERGHNRRTCPKLKDYVARNPDSYVARREASAQKAASTRKCSFCDTAGHNRRKCPTMESMARKAAKMNSEFRKTLLSFMKENGIAEGTLVRANARDVWSYTRDENGELRSPMSTRKEDNVSVIGLITKISWDFIHYRTASGAVKIQWINGYTSAGKQGSVQTSEFDRDNYMNFIKRYEVIGAVDPSRVEASKPYNWERCTAGEVKHFFDETKAYYFPELR